MRRWKIYMRCPELKILLQILKATVDHWETGAAFSQAERVHPWVTVAALLVYR